MEPKVELQEGTGVSTELEASFDAFAISPHGFDVHFQLRGPKVYKEALLLLELMVVDGFPPKARQQQQGFAPPIASEAPPEPAVPARRCQNPAHNGALLTLGWSEKTGKDYWFHDIGEERCFGRKPR